MSAPSSFLDARAARVRASFPAAGGVGIDALIVTSLPNISYLTNFFGSAGIVVLAAGGGYLLTDFRYLSTCRALLASGAGCPGLELVPVERSYDEHLLDLLLRLPGERIGFEAAHVTVKRHQWLTAALGARGEALVPTERIVETARLTKDAHEVTTLRAAAGRLSDVVADLPQLVRAGRTERAIAADIDFRIRQAGFERPAFETIVAAGPQGALPHARPGHRPLADGDLVVLDFGGVYDGYCVDLTRTMAVGTLDPARRDLYDAVAEAHGKAIAAVRPGVLASDIDAAARDALAGRGLGDAFGHGTGHGLGLEVHEEPRIARRPAAAAPGASTAASRDEVIQAGMVFTIEPGAYVEGLGGVRIEDDVLVTTVGCEILTTAPRDLWTA